MTRQDDSFKRTSPGRRRVLAGIGAGAGLAATGLLAGCGPDETTAAGDAGDNKRPFEGETLKVFIYSGSWEQSFRSAFIPAFEAATGATVIADPGWWDSIPKLKASPPDDPAFDLVLTDATQGYPAIREGLFQTIDMDSIPNRRLAAASTLDNWVYKESYGVTFPDSAMTLAWNRDLVGFEPTGWADLLRDDVAGKLGVYNSFYMSLYTFAAMKVGAAGKPGTAHAEMGNNLDGVLQFARDNRDRVGYWWPTSSDMVLNLAQENAAIGNMHSTDMLPALRERPQLAATVPDADRVYIQLMWVVPAATKRKALAEAAIDYLFRPDMQAAFAYGGRMTAQLDVAQKIVADDPLYGQVYPTTEAGVADIQYYPYEAYFKDWDQIVKIWDQEILRSAG